MKFAAFVSWRASFRAWYGDMVTSQSLSSFVRTETYPDEYLSRPISADTRALYESENLVSAKV